MRIKCEDLETETVCKVIYLKATDSRMERTRWLLVVEGLRPMKEAHALGSFSGAFKEVYTQTHQMSKYNKKVIKFKKESLGLFATKSKSLRSA